MITPKDKAPTPVEQAPAPVVSDEQKFAPIKALITPQACHVMTKADIWAHYELERSTREAELTKMRAERDELVGALRKAVADYKWSEGCSCCQNVKAHEKADARLAELLKPDAYEDGSGWNWSKYKTE